MLSEFITWIRQVGKGLLKTREEMKFPGGPASNEKMIRAIGLWSKLYINRAGGDPERGGESLCLAASIAGELARLATSELKTRVAGSERGVFLDEAYQNVVKSLRRYAEYGCAKGGLAFKPYLDGGKIAVDLVQADAFFPTAFNSRGEVSGAVFTERLVRDKSVYTRLERHMLTGERYQIENLAYLSDRPGELGREVLLSEVPEWAGLERSLAIDSVRKPLFGYFRVPQANTVDPFSPLGVSVYARAVDLIRQADQQWERILWEYEGSELAIDASVDLFEKTKDGKLILPEGRKRLFRTYDIDPRESDRIIEVFSPEIRDGSLFNGFNNILKRIEFNCGLAYGTLSDPQNVDKTAEEIRSSKQRSYSTVLDLQKALQSALEDLVYAMDVWATLGGLTPAGSYEMSFDWDDSILVDPATERLRDKEDVRDQIMAPWEYRVKWYGEDEKSAKEKTGAKGKN